MLSIAFNVIFEFLLEDPVAYLVRSWLTFFALYGLAVTVAALYFQHGSSPSLITGIAIGMVMLQYLAGPWIIRWVLDIDWYAALPVRNQQFLKDLCERQGIPVPRIGIIHGAMPNAFTFGRIQKDASIVVTTGLLEALSPDETDAVIAHEVGHIKHWDFLTMTMASIVPLLLYYLYSFARRFKDSHPLTWVAYAAYWVSQFLVLSLSRTREYWADNFAAHATGDASQLVSGLVKICYGMAKVEREGAWAKEYGDAGQKADAQSVSLLAGKIGVMGISSAQAGFVLSGPSPDAASALMRWDLENPWARVYQLASTHPLTAFRIKALNVEAKRQGRSVVYPLPESTTIQWAAFPLELVLWAAPWICAIGLFSLRSLSARHIIAPAFGAAELLGAVLLFSWVARIAYRYQGRFEMATIRELVADTTPSQMRPRAVRIEGEIVGRGQPGAFWCPDLVIKDETGILFVNDRQTIPLARLALAAGADQWIGQRVTLEGWYRRGMMPYVELSRLSGTGNSGQPGASHRSYSYYIQIGLAVVVSGILYWFAAR